ncbi:MAG: carbohydrate binding domain-containing protein, partial [Patescibacteria group bacterium]
MKKIISLLLAFVFAGQIAFAAGVDTQGKLRPVTIDLEKMSYAKQRGDFTEYPQGLRASKIFGPGTDMNLDYSKGEAISAFSVSRDADHPQTYSAVGGALTELLTSNTPAITRGYWNETGFHRATGLLLEGQATNLIQDSDFSQTLTDYWGVSAGAGGSPAISIDSTYTAPYGLVCLFTGSKVSDRVSNALAKRPSVTSGTAYNFSAYLRGSGDIYLWSVVSGGADQYSSKITLSSNEWKRYNFNFTADASNTIIVGLRVREEQAVSAYMACPQLTASAYPSSFIPTTTSALTRNAESLSFYTKNVFPGVKGGDCLSFDGTNDTVAFGNVGNVSHIKIKFLSRPDNQEILTLANSTATAITVAGGTLTFGASLTATNITVDSVSKTAAQAGALINDNTWHTLEFDLTEIAGSNLIVGTDSSAYGDIIVEQLVLNSPATHTYNFAGNVNDSTGEVNGTNSGATWTKDTSEGTLVFMYRPEMLPSEQSGLGYSELFSVAPGLIDIWKLRYDSNANNRIQFQVISNNNAYYAQPASGYCSFYTRFQRHLLLAKWSTTPFVVPGLNSGNPIRMALYDGYETDGVFALHPIAFSVNYVPPVGALPSTYSIQPSARQGMILEGFQIYDRCL